jgi:hypothetical protein
VEHERRATAVVLDGISRRRDDATFVAPLVRWLLASRENGRWGTTQENAVALGALVSYYKTFETETPDLSATVTLSGRQIGAATFAGSHHDGSTGASGDARAG